MSYTVGQLAKLTGLTVRALHHYDAIGLLVPSQRSAAGYRLYIQQDVAKLFRIQSLQTVGLTLGEIGEVLGRDGAALPDLVAQQLASLDEQLEQTTALRNRLAQLHEMLSSGSEPATDDWIAAVELVTQYGKYCSADDIRRLVENRNHDNGNAWRALIADWRRAMDKGISPADPTAVSLLTRWSKLFMHRVGGDLGLAAKLKLAYATEQSLQQRLQVETGITPQMLEYLGDVMTSAHRAACARYLTEQELERLQLHADWQANLMPAVGALSIAVTASDPTVLASALVRWRALLDAVAQGDEALRKKIESLVHTDDTLARLWLISDPVRELLRRESSRLQ